jgi:hypothetical protein
MFYRQPGSETPATSPTLPIPGEMSAEQRYGKRDEKEAKEEEDCQSEAVRLGSIFPALCSFWRVVHRVRWIYYSVHESPPVYLRTTLVEHGYRELIAWAETLPSSLLRREQSPHYVIVFQYVHYESWLRSHTTSQLPYASIGSPTN